MCVRWWRCDNLALLRSLDDATRLPSSAVLFCICLVMELYHWHLITQHFVTSQGKEHALRNVVWEDVEERRAVLFA